MRSMVERFHYSRLKPSPENDWTRFRLHTLANQLSMEHVSSPVITPLPPHHPNPLPPQHDPP